MGNNTDRLAPGGTKDSNYSRKNIREGVYPEAARDNSAKSIFNNITNQVPGYSEFKPGAVPSPAVQRAYEVYMRQSEFKKPYRSGGYPQMETDSDPPPGMGKSDGPKSEGPGNVDVDSPIIPKGYSPISVSFFVQLDKSYEYGGFCRGNTTNIRLFCQEPVYGYGISFNEPGTTVNYVSGYGTNTLILQVIADNNEFDSFRLNVEMRSVEGLTGTTGIIVKEAVCEEYLVLRMEEGAVDIVTVWEMSAGQVSVNIPDNAGTGVVSFPADYADIANWLAHSTLLTESALVSFNAPSWVAPTPTVRSPQYRYNTSCSSDLNFFNGGTWPNVTKDYSGASGANGVPTCDTISETDTETAENTIYTTVNCPAATLRTTPMWYYSYDDSTVNYAAIAPCQEITSLNLVPNTMVLRTEVVGESYWYFTEAADYTPIPDPPPPGNTKPTDLGSGGSSAYMDYTWNTYGSLDPSVSLLTQYHKIDNQESWAKTFKLNGTVSGFSRTLTASTNVPRINYHGGASAISFYQSVYGRHSGVIYYMMEALQVSIGNLGWQGGQVGGFLLSDWENDVDLAVSDLPPIYGVHAAPSYTEEYADNLDICTMTRDTNLESAITDLYAKMRTDLALADGELMPVTMDMTPSIRL